MNDQDVNVYASKTVLPGAGPRHQGNVPANLPPLTVKEQPQSTEEDALQSNFEAQQEHEPLTDRPVASSGYVSSSARHV